MVSLRRRRLILGLDPGKDNPLPLYCEDIPPYRKPMKPKTEHDLSSDSEDGIIPTDRMSSSSGGGRRLGRHGAGGQNRGKRGRGKVTVPLFTQSSAASHSSRQKKKTGAEPSLSEVNVKIYEKKDEKFVDPPSAVVCDNFTVTTDNLSSQLLGSWSV